MDSTSPGDAEQESTRSRGWNWVLAALVTALAVASHLSSSDGEFLYDDLPYVVANPQVQEGGFLEAWTEPLSRRAELGLYRPLPLLTYQWQASGLEPTDSAVALHVANIALHAAATLALAWMLLRAGLGSAWAWSCAALFAVHPVHVEAVAWIVGRAELLAALFGFLFLGWMFRSARASAGWGGAGWWTLACLSKENAFALPAVILIFDVWVHRLRRPADLARRYLPLGLAFGLLVGIRIAVLGQFGPSLSGMAPYDSLSLLERIPVAANLLGKYVQLCLWPFPSRIFYHSTEFLGWGAIALTTAAWLAWLLWRRRQRRMVALGLAFPLTLLPVLNLRPIQETLAERFLYLPSFALCLLLADVLSLSLRREAAATGRLGLGLAPLALVLAAGLATSHLAGQRFRTAEALWDHTESVAPWLPFPHYQRAYFAQEKARRLGDPGAVVSVARHEAVVEAIQQYRRALVLNRELEARGARGMPPDQQARALLNMGILLCQDLPLEEQDYAGAERMLRLSLSVSTEFTRTDPGSSLNDEFRRAALYLAVLRDFDTGIDDDEARTLLTTALTLPSDNVALHEHLIAEVAKIDGAEESGGSE